MRRNKRARHQAKKIAGLKNGLRNHHGQKGVQKAKSRAQRKNDRGEENDPDEQQESSQPERQPDRKTNYAKTDSGICHVGNPALDSSWGLRTQLAPDAEEGFSGPAKK